VKDKIRTERQREVEQARKELLRRAEAQGVKPFVSPAEFADESDLTSEFDVDEFLRQVRENRDHISDRGVE